MIILFIPSEFLFTFYIQYDKICCKSVLKNEMKNHIDFLNVKIMAALNHILSDSVQFLLVLCIFRLNIKID